MRAIFIRLLATSLASLVLGCQPDTSSKIDTTATRDTAVASVLTPGPWRGVLAVQGQEIPFLFEVKTEAGKPVVYLVNKGLNGDQRLRCDKISVAGDSTTVRMHKIDAALVVRANDTDKLKGVWVKYGIKSLLRVPLTAAARAKEPSVSMETAEELFNQDDGSAGKVLPFIHSDMIKGAKYRVSFQENKGKTYQAVCIIRYNTQDNGTLNNLTGTFLTKTGEDRYLAGNIVLRDKVQHLLLGTFDGNHAFLFDAVAEKPQNLTSLKGDFYSSEGSHQTWTAVLDPNAKLPQRQKNASGN